jgi:predicted DNA-binding WGR domain protein
VVKRYELKTKFWSTRVDGNELHVAWGKIGTAGQSKVTTFATQDEALAEAALRARDKVKEGYVEVVQASAGVAASTSKGGSTSDTIPLRYVIADDDVEDDVTLSVAWPGTATAFGETMPIALDGAGIWVFSQESRMPDDPTWSPPFLVPARVADALAAGNTTTVATGFDRDRLHVFVRCELDALSEEAREDASRWSGPKVAARTDEGATRARSCGNRASCPVRTSPVRTSPVRTSPVRTSPVRTSPVRMSRRARSPRARRRAQRSTRWRSCSTTRPRRPSV